MLSLLSFTRNQDNCIAVTRELLGLLTVKVNDSTIEQILKEHPDYPSLLSITDAFREWGVEAIGVKATFEQLLAFPVPFLAHTKNNHLLLITQVSDAGITYRDISGKHKIQLTKEGFLKQWDGVILLAAADDKSGELYYRKKHCEETWQHLSIPLALFVGFLLALLCGIALCRTKGMQSIFPFLFSLVMLAGMIISGLLLWYEVDKQNPVLHKICTAGKHTNCSAILQSGAAKLWGIITWSEIGFAYFTGGFFSLLLSGFNPTVTKIVVWLNLLAMPYIFFSVFYQWRIAKQWCVLCLTIQGLLLAGFIICFTSKDYAVLPNAISVHDITLLIIAYFLPLFLWSKVKPLWLKAKNGEYYKVQLLRLKHDPQIFEALLPRQKAISPEEIKNIGIILGERASKHKLVKVCNPYCGPCARAHPEIEKILENNHDIQTQIIFTATDDKKDIRSLPVKHLMAIYDKGNEIITKQALDNWYNAPTKDYEVFAGKYPLNGELQQQGEKLKAMNDWCKKTGIGFTPTFFISALSPPNDGRDGVWLYQLPDMYSVGDLRYLLG